MKIAIWHNLPSGGGKRALHDQVRGLVDRGHTVEVWCPSTANLDYLPLSPFVREHVLPIQLNGGDSSQKLGTLSRAKRLRNRQRILREHYEQCATQINNGGFDLLLAHPCQFNFVPGVARKISIPSILYLQEPNRGLYEARPDFPWIAPPERPFSISNLSLWLKHIARITGLSIRVREERENAGAFDRILVNSFFSRESVLRAYGLEAHVCYLGIDTSKFRDLKQERENFVVGLSSFHFAKGIDRAIEIIGLIPAPRPRLVWVANAVDSVHLASMNELATAQGVELEVRTNISDPSLIEILNRAALMLYTPRLEPFGYAALEAAACGTPVVAIAEGGIRESIRNGVNGFAVEWDPARIARIVQELLADSAKASEIGNRARLEVEEKWDLASSIDRLEAELTDVCRSTTKSKK